MRQQTKEILETMNGCEINSIHYEGCVMVKGNEVWQDGKVIDTLDTTLKINFLWMELVEQEGI